MLIFSKHTVIKRKLILGFKYIRFKVSTKPHRKEISVKDAVELRTNKLAEILDCTNLTAREIISRNKGILSVETENFIRNAVFCSKYLKFSDVIEFPILISLNSSLLQHRYFSLVELGCSNISASDILKFPQVIKKTPKELQTEGIYFSHDHNLDCFMDLLSSHITNRNEIKLRLQKMYEDGSTLWKIKEAMNADFLSSKLSCSVFKAHQMFHRYPPLRVQSILNTSYLLDTLFQKCDFSVAKVFFVPSLLSLHHEIVVNFLERIPQILGVNTVQIVGKLPLLLRRPINSIQQIERILKDFNISDSQLLCCPKIIAFSPRTLQQRLEYLCSSDDFSLLKSYKKFLWLVYHYNNIKIRLEALKAVDIPCSISMFTVSKTNFERYLCFSECRTHMNDICHYLTEVFNCSGREIDLKLREFPNLYNSSLTNCSKVVEFLLDSEVSKKQLFNGLGIIFYDVDVVKLYFNNLEQHSECQPFSDWTSHYNLIQLLIYVIEVDTGFRGSRLYKSQSGADDGEELNISSCVC